MANKKDMFMNADQVAKELRLSVETVRKRAKDGRELQGFTYSKTVGGRWLFVRSNNIFATGNQRTRAIFVIDRSSSMQPIVGDVSNSLRSQLDEFKKAADSRNQYEVGFIEFSDSVGMFSGFKMVASASVPNIYAYGNTALYRAMVDAIELAEKQMSQDPLMATFVAVLTDGEENCSGISSRDVSSAVMRAQSTGRFTMVVNCPPGAEKLFVDLGIPTGNIKAWEASKLGVQRLTLQNNAGTQCYTSTRSTGITSSSAFYAQPITSNANIFASQLSNNLDEVTDKVKVERVTDKDPVVIKDFCNKKFGTFPKGSVYYQLSESEKVQEYKQIIVQDNATGKFFSGWKTARKLLGLPQDQTGTVRIRPGKLGEFKIFVQSTSVNRKLVPGTVVVRL